MVVSLYERFKVKALSETIRKITTFLLAVIIWLHALFLLNVQSSVAARFAHYLQLTTSEVLLLALVIIFSFASGSGFWRPFRSLLYIYGFPFVVFWKLLYWSGRGLVSLNRWFKAQAGQPTTNTLVLEQKQSSDPPPSSPPAELQAKEKRKEFVDFLLRPFRRFMFLWCILLVVSTHIQIVWVCLIVVMLHLARRMFALLKIMLFFDPYLKRAISNLFDVVGHAIDVVAAFTPETAPSNELRTTWNQLKGWKAITSFLRNEYLVSRWAWFLGAISFGSLYIYVALLFSFAYLGIARVSGISFSWAESLVASLFIPLFATELPKTIYLRLLGGVHCFLVLTIGIGTFYSFLQRRLFAIRTAATVINDRLIDETFDAKFSVLGTKLSESSAKSPQEPTVAQAQIQTKVGKKKKSK
jgi:hypothetical protein